MDFNMSTTQGDDDQTIDPRLLTFGFGLGIDDPHYDLNTRGIELELEGGFDLAPDNINERHDFQNEQMPDVPNEAPPTPQIQLPQPTEGSLDGDSAKDSRRPRLTLETTPVLPDQPIDITPTTPEIRVSGPGFALAGHNSDSRLDIAAPATALSDDGRMLTTPMQRRPRRNSSPARGSRRVRASRYHQPGSPYLSPSPSSSPNTPHSFVLENGYHVGDRSGQSINTNYPEPPTSAPRQRAPSMSGSSNCRRTNEGRYICNEPECPETRAGKFFDTKSHLTKHQRKHMPESERPHGCNYCERRFLYPKDLSRHMKSHKSAEERFQDGETTCKICGNLLSRKDNLDRHMERVHGQAPPTPSSSGRGRRDNTRAVSPSTHSAASMSQYSLSRPGTPLHSLSPTIQAGVALNQVMADYTFGPGDVFVDDTTRMPASPLLAPPMERSRSDFH